MAYKVIDVSYFQGLNINWQAVKDSGVDGAIIRCGQIEKGIPSIDSTFETNYSGAKSVGLHIGSYYTAGATSFEGIQQEANFFKNQLQGKSFDLPVYVDLEDDGDQSFLHANCDSAIQIFKDTLVGYNFGIYAPFGWFKSYIDEERWKDLPLWIAQYNDTMTFQPNYFGMWQKTKSGQINGIDGDVDINELYISYWDRSIQTTPNVTTKSNLPVGVRYKVFIEGKGWSDWYYNGSPAGTEGLCLRLEKVCIELVNPNNLDLHINYKLHIQDIGWTDFVMDGVELGTFGKRIEGIQIILNGNDADKYDVNFRSHVQNIGTQNWAVDGELSGSEGGELRLEALAVLIVNQGVDLGINGIESFSHIVKKTVEEIVNSPTYNPVDNGDGYGLYFTAYEWACDCIKGYDIPNPCDGYPETQYGKSPNLSPRILEVLNDARGRLNSPIVITCGTRCGSSNTYWGGVPDSCHLVGDASDSYCPSLSAIEYAWFLANNYPDIGVRVYPSSGFVHIEVNTSLAGCGVFDQESYCFL